MTQPALLVSVLMPVYNGERFLREAVDSILSQTLTEFEFIIIDDGSTDKTKEIIFSYRDPRIQYFTYQKNQGFIFALDYGLRKATGDWIARMDQDDASHPLRLEEQIGFLRDHPECVFVGTTYDLISPAGKYLKKKDGITGWEYIPKKTITLGKQNFADPSVMYSRKAALNAGGYDFDFKYEIPLWYRLLTKGQGARLNESFYFYRFSINSMSKSISNWEGKRSLSRQTRLKYDPENAHLHSSWDVGTYGSSKDSRKNTYRMAIHLCNATRDWIPALKIFLQAIKEFPFDIQLYKMISYGLMVTIFPHLNVRNADYLCISPNDLMKNTQKDMEVS